MPHSELVTFLTTSGIDFSLDSDVLETHSHDTSLFRVNPQIVIFPKSSLELQNIVATVSELNARGAHYTLTARAAGTDMSGGPLNDSIILSFTKHMHHFLGMDDDVATVEPGMYYRDFEKETLKHKLFFPSYPASRDLCAIGGIIANNSAGEKTLYYGKTEKYIRKIDTVLANGDLVTFSKKTLDEAKDIMAANTEEGRIYREMYDLITENEKVIQENKPTVSKNSAGYYLWNVYNKEENTFDLSQLICGSQGTLGLISNVGLALVPPRKHVRTLLVFLPDLTQIPSLVQKILKFNPESVESYDDHTFKIAIKFFPDIAKRMGNNMFKLGLQFLPEFWMALSGGVPKLILLIEFTGDSEIEVTTQVKGCQEALQPFGYRTKIAASEKEAKKYWTFRRESFNLLRQRMRGLRTAPFIEDVVVELRHLPEFLPRLQTLLDQYDLIYTIAGHIGEGNFHIIPLMNLKDKKNIDIIKKLSKEVYDLVREYHGSITGEHNDGLIRTSFLNEMFSPEMLGLFEKTKDIFDPKGVFNPRKKVRGDIDFAFSHINKD